MAAVRLPANLSKSVIERLSKVRVRGQALNLEESNAPPSARDDSKPYGKSKPPYGKSKPYGKPKSFEKKPYGKPKPYGKAGKRRD